MTPAGADWTWFWSWTPLIGLIGLIGLFGFLCERSGPKTNEYGCPPAMNVEWSEVRGWTCLHE